MDINNPFWITIFICFIYLFYFIIIMDYVSVFLINLWVLCFKTEKMIYPEMLLCYHELNFCFLF